jgi:hypothetical protein
MKAALWLAKMSDDNLKEEETAKKLETYRGGCHQAYINILTLITLHR